MKNIFSVIVAVAPKAVHIERAMLIREVNLKSEIDMNREECICGERDSLEVKALIVKDISISGNLGSSLGLLHS